MGKTIQMNNVDEAAAKIAELQAEGKIGKPSDEEVKQFAEDFEQAKIDFEAKKFEIGEAEMADKVYDFVIEFMEKHVYWTKNGWMGVIRMHEEVNEQRKNRKEDEPFAIGYQALEFLFFALSNPGGQGIETARAIESVADLYAQVIELAGKKVETAREELKDVQWLGDKALAAQQGFYLEKEDGVEAEDAEKPTGFAAPTINDLLGKK